jgi:hypothetical protein
MTILRIFAVNASFRASDLDSDSDLETESKVSDNARLKSAGNETNGNPQPSSMLCTAPLSLRFR